MIEYNLYKKCTRCSSIKVLADFYKSVKGLQGRKSICKSCVNPKQSKDKKLPRNKIKIRKLIALPDIHYPYNIDLSSVEEYMGDYKPDVLIYLGDILDLNYMSKFEIDNKSVTSEQYKNDCDAVEKMLCKHISITSATEVHYLEGNHEYRVQKYLEKEPAGVGSLEIPIMLKLEEKGIIWHSMNKLLKIGKLNFTHGAYYSKFHADKHIQNYGRNMVYGHTHDIQMFSGTRPYDIAAPYVGVSVGCLCTINPTFMKNRPNKWINAFYTAEVYADGNFSDKLIKIIDGKFSAAVEHQIYGGKN